MSTLQRFNDSRVVMYFDDHPPPHVHVKLRDGRDCIVDLNSFEIRGRVATREIREALDWIRARQSVLLEQWHRNHA